MWKHNGTSDRHYVALCVSYILLQTILFHMVCLIFFIESILLFRILFCKQGGFFMQKMSWFCFGVFTKLLAKCISKTKNDVQSSTWSRMLILWWRIPILEKDCWRSRWTRSEKSFAVVKNRRIWVTRRMSKRGFGGHNSCGRPRNSQQAAWPLLRAQHNLRLRKRVFPCAVCRRGIYIDRWQDGTGF
jgi:hypothetical protein